MDYDSFKNFPKLLEEGAHFIGLCLPGEASDEEFGPGGVAEGRRVSVGEIFSHGRRRVD